MVAGKRPMELFWKLSLPKAFENAQGVISLLLCLMILQCVVATEESSSETDEPHVCPMARDVSSMFVSVPEVERAMSTGSIRQPGRHLPQNFSPVCKNLFESKFRTFDGSCNNYRNLGMSMTPVDRLLPAEYHDSSGFPRVKASDGSLLPTARKVSLHAHPSTSRPNTFTPLVMQWGQWVDHDLTALPVALEFDKSIKCCGPNGGNPPFIKRKECFPIELPSKEDHFLGNCMEFTRSIPAVDKFGRELRPREQLNSLTGFLDASQVYGSTLSVAEHLRDPETRYLLRTVNGSFLPPSEENDCILDYNGDYCFAAGDIRVNEQPGLAAMHTLFLREHNRIATELRQLRPNDDDEEIFQLARKIVGALEQTITYNEWLPIILGDGLKRLGLRSLYGRSAFNPGVDPRIFSAFSTAAFRFGHSLIPEKYIIGTRKVPLRQLFNRPHEVLNNFDDLIAGLAGLETTESSSLQSVDRNFVDEITSFLFVPKGGAPNSGLDLVSLNIQRGRDHAVPPYVKYRAFCGLRPLEGFNDTEALGPDVASLAKVYKSINDIDLFTGLMYEPVIDGIVGPTLNCLIGIQFFRLKYGDRFFFTHKDENIGFTDAQLRSIRRSTLAGVICRNTDIQKLPHNVFALPSQKSYYGYDNNVMYSCEDLSTAGLNLKLFRDDH